MVTALANNSNNSNNNEANNFNLQIQNFKPKT